jgi:iron uptake system component EfeO
MRLLTYSVAALSLVGVGLAQADTSKVSQDALDKPIAEYKAYITGEVDALVSQTKKFVAEIKEGDVEEAQQLYAPTRQHYERIEPVAELFHDLDSSMDAREDDFEKKAEDPNWTGFHRIEKSLFADKTTKGLEPLADKLLADVTELQKRLKDLQITPKAFVGGTAELIEEVASTKITGEEDRYSRTDLWDFKANVDGARKIVALVSPILLKQDPELHKKIDANFAKVESILAKYKTKDGYESYEKLTDKDRLALKGPVTALAEDLSTLRGLFGIS